MADEKTFLDETGLAHLWTGLKTKLEAKSDTDHAHDNATTSAAGMMSAADKTKLDGIATGANAYTHPSYTARTGVPTANATPAFGGTFQVTQPASDATGHITSMTSRTIKIPSTAATTSAAGLMSASDKTKLDGIATGANAYTHPSSGVTAGTYKSVTVNAQGHVTAGTNPTTLAGYGITDAASATHTHDAQESLHAITTAGTGAAYTATVDGITALTAGASFIMIPHTVSTTTGPTLNVNSLGAKTIRRRVSNATSSTAAGYAAAWLAASKPILVTYDGTYWIADNPKPAAADMSGTLKVANGGTGATTLTSGSYLVGNGTSAVSLKTPAEVLTDIGAAASSHSHALTDMTGTLPIENGGTGATDADQALINLGGVSRKLLWTNASPTAEFASQSISVDMNAYSDIEIVYLPYRGSRSGSHLSTGMIPSAAFAGAHAFTLNGVKFSGSDNATTATHCLRGGSLGTTYISFGKGYYESNGSVTADNGYCIPYAIYGSLSMLY